MIYLQSQTVKIAQVAQEGTDSLMQYGVLGLFAVILLFVVSVLWKRMNKLEDTLTSYLKEDRKEMMNVIANNTKAFERFEDIMERQ